MGDATCWSRPLAEAARIGLRRSRAGALVATLAAALPSAVLAVTVGFQIDRTSADVTERTFGGSGSVTFDGPTSDPADISLLSLQISTLGTVYDQDGVPTPATFDFVFDAADVTAVSGLAAVGGGLAGSISFAGSVSEDGGLVAMDFFELDFDAGLASGFCFYGTDILAECITDGGSSSGVEAILSVAPVPLPASLPLFGLAIAGLGCLARRARHGPPAGPRGASA